MAGKTTGVSLHLSDTDFRGDFEGSNFSRAYAPSQQKRKRFTFPIHRKGFTHFTLCVCSVLRFVFTECVMPLPSNASQAMSSAGMSPDDLFSRFLSQLHIP